MLGGGCFLVFLLWAGKGQLDATGQEVPQNKRQAGVTGPGREGKGVKREGETKRWKSSWALQAMVTSCVWREWSTSKFSVALAWGKQQFAYSVLGWLHVFLLHPLLRHLSDQITAQNLYGHTIFYQFPADPKYYCHAAIVYNIKASLVSTTVITLFNVRSQTKRLIKQKDCIENTYIIQYFKKYRA